MKALEYVKELGHEPAIAAIAASGICNYGVFSWAVAERWRKVRAAGKPVRVGAALNNADVDGVLSAVLEQEPEAVLEGLQIAMELLGTTEAVLQLPETAVTLAKELEPLAAANNICIQTGFINVRDSQDILWMHMVTMKELSDCFRRQYKPGIYASVNRGALKKYPADCKLSEMVAAEGLKAVQIGYHLYSPAVLEQTLAEIPVPNGVINGIADNACLVCEAEERSLEFRKNSCGKCVFCREGLIQLNGMMQDIAGGKGKNEYPELAREVGAAMAFSTLCSLGQEAAGFVLDTLSEFPGEVNAHIRKKQCPAEVCKSLQIIYIDPQTCTGCGECVEVCPAGCIEGKSGFIHMIDDFECTKCGKCVAVCDAGAVIRAAGRIPRLPGRLIKCGKFKKR